MKDKIMDGFLGFAEVLQTQKHLSAVKNAFTALLPLIITGAFCTLISNIVCSTTTTGFSLAKINGLGFLEGLSPMFTAANYATMNFMAISIVLLIAMELGKYYNHTEFVLPIVALACYISLCSTFTTITVNETATVVNNVLPKGFTDAQGLFLGMFTALISTELYVKIVDSQKFEIKMPDTVPFNVSKSFNVLIPCILVVLIVAGFGMIFQMIFKITLYQAISVVIQKPLTNVLTGLPGYLLIYFVSTLLWVFGIHGTQVLAAITSPIMLAALAENTDAALLGLQAPNILSSPFVSCFTTTTGAGITSGLIVAILLFSKRDDYKAIAKLSIPLGLFNINESMTFGLPVVLNPILAIPFMLAPLTSASFAYFMTSIGFAGRLCYAVPWTTPPVIQAFLASGGSVGAAVTQFLCLCISFVIYIPFVLISNKSNPANVAEA